MQSENQIPCSTWPKDAIASATPIKRDDASHLICFLACPFEPKNKQDDLLRFVQDVCNEIGSLIGANIECRRSDTISTPGIIHFDIWTHLAQADALIFDVTGKNGNVLLELGAAATYRSPQSIIILKDSSDVSPEKFLFDISPARHILYSLVSYGDQLAFHLKLKEALEFTLTPSPFGLLESNKSLDRKSVV
jgi:hypothetical protein